MLTLTQAAKAVASGEVSPVDLVRQALDAIELVQPKLNAFTQVFADEALARADELAGAAPAGPLHGVPVAVKDLYDVAGARTSGCCDAYDERPPVSDDSAVVEKLRAAGAIVVAKTNQHELACGATTLNSSYGPAFNPWDAARICGGSSGGSGIAVATGVVAMAMGSDTGGSIRIPASFCGVTGLKPTHGSVSLRGAMPMCPSLDTAGPLARSAEDCLLVHEIIAGTDPGYLWSRNGRPEPNRPVAGLRVGIPQSYMKLVHREVLDAIAASADVFRSLGATIVELEGPDIDLAFGTFGTRIAEVVHCYPDLVGDSRISPNLAGFMAIGQSITGPQFFAGRETGLKIRSDFLRGLDEADVLLAPCTAFPAPRIDDQSVAVEGGSVDVHQGGCARLTLPVNIAGLPALAFPVGFSSMGTPIGAQLIGRDWSEAFVSGMGAAYQSETDWHTRVAQIA